MVVGSAGHVGGTRGSGIVSSAAYVLWMRGVGGVGEICKYMYVRYVCVSDNQLEDDRSSAGVLSLACIRSTQPS